MQDELDVVSLRIRHVSGAVECSTRALAKRMRTRTQVPSESRQEKTTKRYDARLW
jgi:hypothetical protein